MTDQKNAAFIDSQNLNLGTQTLGWKLDFKKFYIYLKEKYSVKKTYLFIGYTRSNKRLYCFLKRTGYILCFKPAIPGEDGKLKGNTDADLVLKAMVTLNEYDRALIVSGDGDFYSLVKYLQNNNKLLGVMSPNRNRCSGLLKQSAKEKMYFLDDLKNRLKYNEKGPLEDETSSSPFP